MILHPSRKGKLAVLAAVATAAAAGCGSDDSPRAATTAAPQQTTTASRADLGTTDGRTGEATRASDDGRRVQLSPGGRPDPEAKPRPGVRGGVVDPASCPGDPSAAPADGNLAAVARVTLCLINQERTERGLVALTANDQLAATARGHAKDMVARSYFSHDSPSGTSAVERIRETDYIPRSGRWTVGENLAWGAGALAPADAIHNAWMNSKGHRDNILNAAYREIGIGIVLGNPAASNGAGATYATEFGAVAGSRTTAARTRRLPACNSRRKSTKRSTRCRRVGALRYRRASR